MMLYGSRFIGIYILQQTYIFVDSEKNYAFVMILVSIITSILIFLMVAGTGIFDDLGIFGTLVIFYVSAMSIFMALLLVAEKFRQATSRRKLKIISQRVNNDAKKVEVDKARMNHRGTFDEAERTARNREKIVSIICLVCLVATCVLIYFY